MCRYKYLLEFPLFISLISGGMERKLCNQLNQSQCQISRNITSTVLQEETLGSSARSTLFSNIRDASRVEALAILFGGRCKSPIYRTVFVILITRNGVITIKAVAKWLKDS